MSGGRSVKRLVDTSLFEQAMLVLSIELGDDVTEAGDLEQRLHRLRQASADCVRAITQLQTAIDDYVAVHEARH